MSTAMQLEAHNAVAAAEATATVETVVEQMDVAGPSDEPLLSMVEQAEVDARRVTQSAETRADMADALVTMRLYIFSKLRGAHVEHLLGRGCG